MKTEVRISFGGNHIPGGGLTILGPAGCGPDVATVEDVKALFQIFVVVVLDAADERLPVLRALLKQHNENYGERYTDWYTEDELESARLLIMHPQREHTVFGGPRVGTRYDLEDACLTCGAGARQTSALMIEDDEERSLKGRRVAATPYSDILVDEPTAEELIAIGARGLSFRDVYAVMEDKGQVKLPWRQLQAAKTLPPFSVLSTGATRKYPCDSCSRSGFVGSMKAPPRLVYHAKDLAEIDDVNTTWEWFGDVKFNGDVSEALLPYPWFLVTPKVMRVLRAAGATAFDWFPVRIENADGSIDGPVPEVLSPESRAKRASVSDFSPEQRALLTAEVSAGVAEREKGQEEVLAWMDRVGFGTGDRPK